MPNKSILFTAFFAAALFTACDDDSVSSSNNSQQAGCTVSENKDGSYKLSCADGTEVTLYDGKDGADGKDGKDGKDGTNGTDGKDGTNGADGKDGKKGSDGKDGAGISCTVADTAVVVADADTVRTGYNLTCGTELKGTVWNGDAGSGCTFEELPNGTGNKIVCGGDSVGVVLNNGYDICGPSKLYKPSSQMCDTRDNQIYRIRTIRTQTWMLQNLNYNYNEGSAKSYCYGDLAHYCAEYGRLYTREAAKSACPTGWHLPNDDE